VTEPVPTRSLGRFVASVLCGIAGLGLGVGGVLQLGVGLHNLAYPQAWQFSEDRGLGPPAIATPDTIWMSPMASNTRNLLTVTLASIAGVTLVVAAGFGLRGPFSRAALTGLYGIVLAAIFLLSLLTA